GQWAKEATGLQSQAADCLLRTTHREGFRLDDGVDHVDENTPGATTLPTADGNVTTTKERQTVHQPGEILRTIGELTGLIRTDARVDHESCDRRIPITEHPQVQALPSPAQIQTDPCLICGHTAAQEKYTIEGVTERFVQCASCGLGSVFPMPEAARIESFYPAEYYGTPSAKFEPTVEAGVRVGARLRVQSLLSGLPGDSHVLDIGCGRGVMLRALLDLGYTAHGVEISREAAAGVDPRAHVRIAADLNNAGYSTDSMDAIILWHVLEHLPDPERTLAEIRRILKPGGRLILAVPNCASWQARWAKQDWFHLDLPRHLYHFSPETLSMLLHRHGFAQQSCHHFAALQNPFGWLQSWFNRMSASPRNRLYSLLHRGGNHDDVQQLNPIRKLLFKVAFAIGLPVAGLLSCVEAGAGRGGTITVTATPVVHCEDQPDPLVPREASLAGTV
ncbi:MAG: class I SAM-dependent methyltransferase, partial [Planctomycetaceae bacterium]